MADLSELVIRVRSDGVTDTIQQLRNLGIEAERVRNHSRDINSLDDAFNDLNVSALAGAAGVGTLLKALASLKGFADSTVAAFGEFESIKTNLGVVMGSAEIASETFEELKKLGAKTPFSVTGLAEASTQLLQTGTAAEDLTTTLRLLGDVAGGNAVTFDRIVANYAQIQSIGQTTAMDIKQFAAAGLPIYEVMKDMGVQGNLTAEQVTEAFRRMAGEGGTFFNGMEIASTTLNGKLSTLGDTWDEFQATFADVSGFVAVRTQITELKTKALEVLLDILNKANENPVLKTLLQGAIVAAITTLAGVIVSALIPAIAKVVGLITAATGGMNLLVGAAVGLGTALAGFAGFKIFEKIREANIASEMKIWNEELDELQSRNTALDPMLATVRYTKNELKEAKEILNSYKPKELLSEEGLKAHQIQLLEIMKTIDKVYDSEQEIYGNSVDWRKDGFQSVSDVYQNEYLQQLIKQYNDYSQKVSFVQSSLESQNNLLKTQKQIQDEIAASEENYLSLMGDVESAWMSTAEGKAAKLDEQIEKYEQMLALGVQMSVYDENIAKFAGSSYVGHTEYKKLDDETTSKVQAILDELKKQRIKTTSSGYSSAKKDEYTYKTWQALYKNFSGLETSGKKGSDIVNEISRMESYNIEYYRNLTNQGYEFTNELGSSIKEYIKLFAEMQKNFEITKEGGLTERSRSSYYQFNKDIAQEILDTLGLTLEEALTVDEKGKYNIFDTAVDTVIRKEGYKTSNLYSYASEGPTGDNYEIWRGNILENLRDADRYTQLYENLKNLVKEYNKESISNLDKEYNLLNKTSEEMERENLMRDYALSKEQASLILMAKQRNERAKMIQEARETVRSAENNYISGVGNFSNVLDAKIEEMKLLVASGRAQLEQLQELEDRKSRLGGTYFADSSSRTLQRLADDYSAGRQIDMAQLFGAGIINSVSSTFGTSGLGQIVSNSEMYGMGGGMGMQFIQSVMKVISEIEGIDQILEVTYYIVKEFEPLFKALLLPLLMLSKLFVELAKVIMNFLNTMTGGLIQDMADSWDMLVSAQDDETEAIKRTTEQMQNLYKAMLQEEEYYLTKKREINAGIYNESIGAKNVNDMILTPQGKFSTNPNDYIIATKNPSALAGGGSVVNMSVQINNELGSVANVTATQSEDAEGNKQLLINISRKIANDYATGSNGWDSAINYNAGRRQGRNII